MNLSHERAKLITRRHFFKRCNTGVGAIALSSLLGNDLLANVGASAAAAAPSANPLAPKAGHHAARAKRVIYLHMSGSPPQHDLFDYKPKLNELNGSPCPKEFIKNERFAFIKGTPKILGSPYKFARHGKSGAWVSELLPHIAKHADDLTFVKSMWTDQFNHAPAEMLLYTGSNISGRASMGSWVTYGLGSESQDLPGFVVLVSGGTDPTGGKSLWSSGFLPSVYQGVQCRSSGEPILYVSDPTGMSRAVRRRRLDALKRLNEIELHVSLIPETLTRINQYELAYRMQMAVPEVMDIARESKHVLEDYGRSRRRVVREQLPARPTARGEGRAVRAAVRLGLGHARHREDRRPHDPTPRQEQGDGPPGRRPAEGPEAARPARGHARDLGRRVRPHAAQRGAQRLQAPRPRPPPARVHDLDGRRRACGRGASPTARPTTSATTSPTSGCTSTTCRPRSSTCSASTRMGSTTRTRA